MTSFSQRNFTLGLVISSNFYWILGTPQQQLVMHETSKEHYVLQELSTMVERWKPEALGLHETHLYKSPTRNASLNLYIQVESSLTLIVKYYFLLTLQYTIQSSLERRRRRLIRSHWMGTTGQSYSHQKRKHELWKWKNKPTMIRYSRRENRGKWKHTCRCYTQWRHRGMNSWWIRWRSLPAYTFHS